MPFFEVTQDGLSPVPENSFVSEGVRERQDLQRWLRDMPQALGENLFIVGEEFSRWEDSLRRIDLLALDEEANLVVVELKRTEDGGHMDLQAVRYAAMISAMDFDDVVDAHQDFLSRRDPEKKDGARAAILAFLGVPDAADVSISSSPRILLVSRDFSKEVTTTALWLIAQGLSVRCVQLIPYKLDGRLYLDLRQVIPLASADEYQVQLRHKEAQTRQRATLSRRRELTLSVLLRLGALSKGTEVEVVQAARPDDANSQPATVFRARLENPDSRDSFLWLHDNQCYSLSSLSTKLSVDHGFKWLMSNTYYHWRIVGHEGSMWDEAERDRASAPDH